jgi:fructose-bisphosphate aldolase class II
MIGAVTLTTTAALVDAARRAGTAVGAFNVITLEHAEAIVAGAAEVEVGVILQVSQNAARFHGGNPGPIVAACRALADGCPVDVAVHLDHVGDLALLEGIETLGVSSVMFDASSKSYDDNVAATAAVVQRLHGVGLWVEAELGEVGGKDGDHRGAHDPHARTVPAEAVAYVAATGVDALAVAVGSSHAMTERTAQLDLDLVAELAAAVPVPLVLHGSSGVAPVGLRDAARAGITKINVGTALNVAFTGAVRSVLDEHAELTDPRQYLAPARAATTAEVAALLTALAR